MSVSEDTRARLHVSELINSCAGLANAIDTNVVALHSVHNYPIR